MGSEQTKKLTQQGSSYDPSEIPLIGAEWGIRPPVVFNWEGRMSDKSKYTTYEEHLMDANAKLRLKLAEARKEFREADSKQYQATTERNIALKERDTAIAEAERMRVALLRLITHAKAFQHMAQNFDETDTTDHNLTVALELADAALSAPTEKKGEGA